jgi:hypothetical protein
MEKKFESKHKLPFLVAEYKQQIKDGHEWNLFKVGTCEGLFSVRGSSYYILAIENKEKNNGHFDDVLEWFENSCKRDNYNLVFLEVWNKSFMEHLISKRGFKTKGFDAEKNFKTEK